jgi:Domain of unknown function (DUF6398)
MKLTAIDKAFGVGESTGQGKSKTIRTMLKIPQFDHHWALPSRMDDCTMIWVVEVNGFMTDIRRCTREIQEIGDFSLKPTALCCSTTALDSES